MNASAQNTTKGSGSGRRGIQGEKWTKEEEIRLTALWDEYRVRSNSRYGIEIWQPISDRMPGRKPDACHQKAYRMGLLSDQVQSGGGRKERVVREREPRMRESRLEPVPVPVYQPELQDGRMSDEVGAWTGMRMDGGMGARAVARAEEDVAANGVNGFPEVMEVREVRPEDAWKHDRRNARGKVWRMERHLARGRWRPGLHHANLKSFCSPSCEGCAEERARGL